MVIFGDGQICVLVSNNHIDYVIDLGDEAALIGNQDQIVTSSIEQAYSTNDLFDVMDLYSNTYPPLPSEGEVVKKKLFYTYSSSVVQCVKSHERTADDPEDLPEYFMFRRTGPGTLSWIVNEHVKIDDIREYDSIDYKCIKNHKTKVGLEPPNSSKNWVLNT